MSYDASGKKVINFRVPAEIKNMTGTTVHDVLKDGSPLVSSDPLCPIKGFQIYKDDGNGLITGEPQPREVYLETERTNLTSNIIVDNDISAS